jgi:hypothetical protein
MGKTPAKTDHVGLSIRPEGVTRIGMPRILCRPNQLFKFQIRSGTPCHSERSGRAG